MYDWLGDALQGPATVVTANRRLARRLREQFAQEQVRQGRAAWRTPDIHARQDWLDRLMLSATNPQSLPVRLNRFQSQLLWERCLAKEFGDTTAGLVNLVRLSRDAWQRLADWQVSITDVARSVQNEDQRRFASVAGRYLGILDREGWVDDAGLAAVVRDLLACGAIAAEGRVTFAGFDRERPIVKSVGEALVERGCDVRTTEVVDREARLQLSSFENSEAELRAAGAWARARILADPESRIAIIAGNLESDAESKTRLVREGLVPGWQHTGEAAARAVNVSYGRKLIEYPAVSVALLLMRWLERDLGATEVSRLLLSPLIASGALGERGRIELQLRRLPDRNWSPAMISSALRSDGAQGWYGLVTSLTRWRRELPDRASPANWATRLHDILGLAGWPGEAALESDEFQLVNRWREILNELARLELVSSSMTLKQVLQRLERMCADTVFQPESRGASLQLIGPLEASGAEFDALWISGLTATSWPPPGNASPLVSRRLQRDYGMPDADPADTLAYAQNMLDRLCHAAPVVVCSYPVNEDDAVQTPSDLLRQFVPAEGPVHPDPGWQATRLAAEGSTLVVRDRTPAVAADERITGGANTLQRQLTDPLAAFVTGRLAVRPIQPQVIGITPALRGNMIHDVLYRLYVDQPSRDEIRRWSDDELAATLERVLRGAFSNHERNSDPVLFELLRLERQRIADVVRRFVAVDCARDDFAVAGTETQIDYSQGPVRLRFRIDRIDRLEDGSLMLIDYKTGAQKSFLLASGEPRDMQLVAYTTAIGEPVASLALAYLDMRDVSFSGAGRGFSTRDDWPAVLDGWIAQLRQACDDLARGDVRINPQQSMRDARQLNLLSRYTEIVRDRS